MLISFQICHCNKLILLPEKIEEGYKSSMWELFKSDHYLTTNGNLKFKNVGKLPKSFIQSKVDLRAITAKEIEFLFCSVLSVLINMWLLQSCVNLFLKYVVAGNEFDPEVL